MARYCICRKKDGTGFMIQCERCMEWFHGKCINLTKKDSKYIEKYYCQACRDTNSDLKIVYEIGHEPVTTDTKQVTIKQEPGEEKKPEKKVLEKIQPVPKSSTQFKSQSLTNKKKLNQKSKSKSHNKKQCANPDCIYECRADSKYCSEECGMAFNRARYEYFFIPKWRQLEENHSESKQLKRSEIVKLNNEKEDLFQLIRSLKEENEELIRNIRIIKEKCTKLAKENAKVKNENKDDDDSSSDSGEEVLSGDASKTFCVTCGITIANYQTLKHWAVCHKKHEATYNFSADAVFQHHLCIEDENPKLYCHQQDKKTKRYCMHLESACPQHSNWSCDKDEVCGCPLNIMQKLDPNKADGFCLELKRDCQQHYHWDKFRLAQLNIQRIQAFTRLDVILDKIRIASANYDDTYGGVVGVMLHNTIDHKPKSEPETVGDVEVDMTLN